MALKVTISGINFGWDRGFWTWIGTPYKTPLFELTTRDIGVCKEQLCTKATTVQDVRPHYPRKRASTTIFWASAREGSGRWKGKHRFAFSQFRSVFTFLCAPLKLLLASSAYLHLCATHNRCALQSHIPITAFKNPSRECFTASYKLSIRCTGNILWPFPYTCFTALSVTPVSWYNNSFF